jgi:hypothetical protein
VTDKQEGREAKINAVCSLPAHAPAKVAVAEIAWRRWQVTEMNAALLPTDALHHLLHPRSPFSADRHRPHLHSAPPSFGLPWRHSSEFVKPAERY